MNLPLFAAAAFSLATAAQAAPQASAAWSRPAAQGAMAVGYMTLRNPAKTPDALLAVESPLAGSVMIHQSSVSGGVASMRMVDRVPLAPGAGVTFSPGGYHLMFTGLTKALNIGDTLPATLTFASGAKVKVAFVVGLAPPAAARGRP